MPRCALRPSANPQQVLIDLKEVATGSLEEDWDMLPPKKIKACGRGRFGPHWEWHIVQLALP
jgi:hypothetical protein